MKIWTPILNARQAALLPQRGFAAIRHARADGCTLVAKKVVQALRDWSIRIRVVAGSVIGSPVRYNDTKADRSLVAHTSHGVPGLLSRAAGFTLVEVIVAMSIAMLLIGVASLSITAVNDEGKLRREASQIEITVRDSLMKAVSTYNPVQLDLASFGSVQVRRYGDKQFRAPKSGETWEFSPTGVCEPVEIRVTRDEGTIEMGFDPLTGCARKRNIVVNG